jgi:hypothetical protein
MLSKISQAGCFLRDVGGSVRADFKPALTYYHHAGCGVQHRGQTLKIDIIKML